MNVLIPKDKESILEDFLSMSMHAFANRRLEFAHMFDEDVPEEYHPLISRIYKDLNDNRCISMVSAWGPETRFNKRKVDYRGKPLSLTEFMMVQSPEHVSIKVFPFQKTESLKHIIRGNEFLIENFDQYLVFADFYKL